MNREAASDAQRMGRADIVAVCTLLVLYAVLVMALCHRVGVTSDERPYVFAGRFIRAIGDWNHPIPRLHGPLPFLANQWLILNRALDDYSVDTMARARLGMLPFGVLAGLVVFLWSRAAFGAAAGLFSLLLFVLNPLMLGYGALVAVDMAHTACALLALYLLWRYLEAPNTWRLLRIGPALGTAFATKYLTLFYGPLVVAAVMGREIAAARGRASRWRWVRPVGAALAVAILSYATLHAWYGLRGGVVSHRDAAIESKPLTALLELPVLSWPLRALPLPYLVGLDFQIYVAQGGPPVFLNGTFARGHWDYYVWSFLLKTPEVVLLLLVVLGWRCVAHGVARPLLFAVIGTAASLSLAYLSFAHRLQIGVRYMLPVYPLLFVALGALMRDPVLGRGVPRLVLLAATVGGSTMVVAGQWPNLIAYYNGIRGGERDAYRHFQDSNSDWGQLAESGLERLRATETAPFTVIAPSNGARFGRVAAYLTSLSAPDPEDPQRSRHWLDPFVPVRHIGAAWYLFDVTPDAFEAAVRSTPDPRVRADLALAYLAAGRPSDFERHMALLGAPHAAPLRRVRNLVRRHEREGGTVGLALAAAWLGAKRPDLALEVLPALRDDRSVEAVGLRVAALLASQQVVEAAALLESYLERGSDPRGRLLLAELYNRDLCFTNTLALLQTGMDDLGPAEASSRERLLSQAMRFMVPSEAVDLVSSEVRRRCGHGAGGTGAPAEPAHP